MKAITIHQPWASLLACGAKRYETRSWQTKYRGPIAIHASVMKRKCYDFIGSAVIDVMEEALISGQQSYLFNDLPHGGIIATAMLVECWKVIEHTPTAIILKQSNGIGEDKISINDPCLKFGDYSVGRYVWGLTNMIMFPEPIPAKGQQGLWNWEDKSCKN